MALFKVFYIIWWLDQNLLNHVKALSHGYIFATHFVLDFLRRKNYSTIMILKFYEIYIELYNNHWTFHFWNILPYMLTANPFHSCKARVLSNSVQHTHTSSKKQQFKFQLPNQQLHASCSS